MLRFVLLLLLLVVGAVPSAADEDPARPPPGPMTPAQVADAVVAAHGSGDEAVIRALATRPVPDPWVVADELCGRVELDAADAYARATASPATEGLTGYVSSRRGAESDADSRRALTRLLRALAVQDWSAVIEAASESPSPLDKVTGIRLAWGRGVALLQLRKLEEGVGALREAASAARTLGWSTAAASMFDQAAHGAFQRSDWVGALGDLEASLALKEKLGESKAAAETLANIGLVRQQRGEYRAAMQAQKDALARQMELGDRAAQATALGNIGNIHVRLAEYDAALKAQHDALVLFEKLDDRSGVLRTLGNIGVVQEMQGAYVESLQTQERVLGLRKDVGDETGMAGSWTNIGNLQLRLGDLTKALRAYEEAQSLHKKTGDRVRAAQALAHTGVVEERQQKYARALATQRQALKLQRGLDDPMGTATTLANIGTIYANLGKYTAAFGALEEALAITRDLGVPARTAWVTGELGSLYLRLGDEDKALRLFQQERDAWQAIGGDRAGLVASLMRIGLVEERRGEIEAALETQDRALRLYEELDNPYGAAFAMGIVGGLQRKRGDLARSAKTLGKALAMAEALGDRQLQARMHGELGLTHWAAGRLEQARTGLEKAVSMASYLRTTPILVEYMGPLARLRLESGDVGRALAESLQALRHLEDLLGHLGEEEGASTRSLFTEVYGVGVLAAVRIDDPAETLRFLESGRAGLLLESLDGRRALSWAELPPPLRLAQDEACALESRAKHEYDRAVSTDELQKIRTCRVTLDAARERVREVSARIQREAKRQAGLFYPRAAPLDEVRGHLDPGQALVLYGLCLDDVLALVLTHDTERIVGLGSVETIRDACGALNAADPRAEVASALAALRKHLVDPLDLPDSVTTVLVSPEGCLSYLPFGALFENRAVALTPSGTAHVILREDERALGRDVLALGDPTYDADAAPVFWRGRRLRRLPASRDEARVVGDVVLLGSEASEDAFRRIMAEARAEGRRWHAVHLACHGLLDVEQPTGCALALSPGEKEDGFLTVYEVLRMQIPADLVVLSACDSSKGRIWRGEGIVGFTRAFLYAGTSRVLCSLWKVDDDATQALMLKFYELWRGDAALGAAEALKAAQDHVRGHEKWKHPSYWAAWVLWGLPD